jgi:uncharacterized membrane-anchored protein YitT (DUF2179 family)
MSYLFYSLELAVANIPFFAFGYLFKGKQSFKYGYVLYPYSQFSPRHCELGVYPSTSSCSVFLCIYKKLIVCAFLKKHINCHFHLAFFISHHYLYSN